MRTPYVSAAILMLIAFVMSYVGLAQSHVPPAAEAPPPSNAAA
jgi:hypothetical protein